MAVTERVEIDRRYFPPFRSLLSLSSNVLGNKKLVLGISKKMLVPLALASRGGSIMMAVEPSVDFARGSDLLELGDRVTARQIANILGRWETHTDWDTIGRAGKLDDLSSGDFYEEDLEVVKTDYSKGEAYYLARRPQRRAFCKKRNLVQRWVHAENVGSLPFTSETLAASVGATVEELNAEPVDDLAAQTVFDALCASKAGFVNATICDERRASFLTADGALDVQAFGNALDTARRNIVVGLLIYPGFLIFVGLVVAVQVDAWHLLLAAAAQVAEQSKSNVQTYGAGPILCALPVFALTAKGGLDRQAGKFTGRAELDVKEKDRLYMEMAKLMKSGSNETEAVRLIREQEKEKRNARKSGPKLTF